MRNDSHGDNPTSMREPAKAMVKLNTADLPPIPVPADEGTPDFQVEDKSPTKCASPMTRDGIVVYMNNPDVPQDRNSSDVMHRPAANPVG